MASPKISDLNEHHQSAINNYLQFARYQRNQYLKSVQATFEDVMKSRLLEDTFTKDEVEELVKNTKDLVCSDLETELIHFSHTNILLLFQMFTQAEKWHLELTPDLSEIQNKELLEAVQSVDKDIIKLEKLKLAPLQQIDPSEVLRSEIQKLQQENNMLIKDLQDLQNKVLTIRQENEEWSGICECKDKKIAELTAVIEANAAEIFTVSNKEPEGFLTEKILDDYEAVLKEQIAAELKQMRQELLTVQSQLTLAELELEKKFNNTAAYNNMKKIILGKNEQIKELRKRLMKYEPILDETVDGVKL